VGAVIWLLRGMMKVCAFMFGLGLIALAIAAANELFGLGIFNDDYPVIDFGGSGPKPGTFGEYVAQTGLITLIAGVVGTVLFYFVGEPEDEFEPEYGSVSDKEYGCPECGKRFVAPSAVEQHYREKHT
jgi:hypothetical protein